MLVLAFSYPILAHAAVVTQQPILQWAALSCVPLNLLWRPLKANNRGALALFFSLQLLIFAVIYFGATLYLLYSPPVLIALLMLWRFASTLQAGRTAIIVVIAEAINGPLQQKERDYATCVTWLWTLLFALMAVSNLMLALLADEQLWSFFANFMNYLILAAVFLLEFGFRKYWLAELQPLNFVTYIQRCATINWPALLRTLDQPQKHSKGDAEHE